MSDDNKVIPIDNDVVVGFEPDKEIRVWAMDEKGALAFFGFSAYDKVVRVIKDAPETEREKEKYDAKAKLFSISKRVREPTVDKVVLFAELLRDATLLLREAKPVMKSTHTTNGENWEKCYRDLMKRIKDATEK